MPVSKSATLQLLLFGMIFLYHVYIMEVCVVAVILNSQLQKNQGKVVNHVLSFQIVHGESQAIMEVLSRQWEISLHFFSLSLMPPILSLLFLLYNFHLKIQFFCILKILHKCIYIIIIYCCKREVGPLFVPATQ